MFPTILSLFPLFSRTFAAFAPSGWFRGHARTARWNEEARPNRFADRGYSIHDMSRVELDSTPPPTPRFNLPFELGLSVLHANRSPDAHTWFLFESVNWRIQKSLSDLNGTDPYIHDGTVEGVFRELAKAFVRADRQPSVR